VERVRTPDALHIIRPSGAIIMLDNLPVEVVHPKRFSLIFTGYLRSPEQAAMLLDQVRNSSAVCCSGFSAARHRGLQTQNPGWSVRCLPFVSGR
jgi:hypothetical protein